jgi:hypothetical protein
MKRFFNERDIIQAYLHVICSVSQAVHKEWNNDY